jgi:hypothetical protein
MAGRLGSTDSVNTIVIAHPSFLTPAQIRAIKVGYPLIVVHLMVSPASSHRSRLVGCWPKVTYLFSSSMCTTPLIVHH